MFCFMVPYRLVDGFEEMSPSTHIAVRPKFRECTERQQKTVNFPSYVFLSSNKKSSTNGRIIV